MRAIRGATTVAENTATAIIEASKELLLEIINRNQLQEEELVSIIFTATRDLNQAYPAVAAREMGLRLIPLLCLQEMEVEASLKKCLRVLVTVNRDTGLQEIKHVYLRGARILRPDLAGSE